MLQDGIGDEVLDARRVVGRRVPMCPGDDRPAVVDDLAAIFVPPMSTPIVKVLSAQSATR